MCPKPANKKIEVSFFLILNCICLCPSHWDSYLIYKTESSYNKNKKGENQAIYLHFLVVVVDFGTDGNISQWKFYKNFHLLTLSAGLKFFPGENVERESLSMLCSVCMGFSLSAFRKVRKPFHYSNWVFFFSSTWANGQFHHLGLSSRNKEGTVWGRVVMHRQWDSPRAGVDFQSSDNCQKKLPELWFLQSCLNSLM